MIQKVKINVYKKMTANDSNPSFRVLAQKRAAHPS